MHAHTPNTIHHPAIMSYVTEQINLGVGVIFFPIFTGVLLFILRRRILLCYTIIWTVRPYMVRRDSSYGAHVVRGISAHREVPEGKQHPKISAVHVKLFHRNHAYHFSTKQINVQDYLNNVYHEYHLLYKIFFEVII